MTRYSRAPITEAVIDIRVTSPTGLTVDALAAGFAVGQERYPEKKVRWAFQGQFTAGAQLGASVGQQSIGHQFSSTDGKQIFQARLDGFTFSRLAPYHRWETFRDEAKRLWECYRQVVQPLAITRLAVRYINRMDLPAPADLRSYLRTLPDISPDMPQGLSGYFMQVQIPLTEEKGTLILNEALVDPVTPEYMSVILDIDIARQTEIPQEDTSIWDYFEQLRRRKNAIFEACITEKTRELIA